MAYRGARVVGTPYRKIENTAHQGIKPGTPKGFSGGSETSPDQYEGSQRGNRQVRSEMSGGRREIGTEYHSDAGNGPEFRREVSHGEHGGHVISEHGQNMNDPSSNGNGVILDHMSREAGYTPKGDRTMDSPVPERAPDFDTRTIAEENRAHAGRRNERTAVDTLASIGGVMSRGMEGTSDGESEDELEVNEDLGPKGHADTD